MKSQNRFFFPVQMNASRFLLGCLGMPSILNVPVSMRKLFILQACSLCFQYQQLVKLRKVFNSKKGPFS